ncbi:sensor histidine kinase [Nafulsella turpanensis]|uniref:sensor histidine kinase n=1 Tax=Nafulsella turpanensis TaxID=1265690 RepID=UPI00036B4BB3|nr:histidine kinase [Nafulsella turpanensis]
MKKQLLLLQFIGWAVAFALFYVYLAARLQGGPYVLAISLSSFASFMLIIYGYATFLYPRYYPRLSAMTFVATVSLFFILVVLARLGVEWLIIGPMGSSSTIFNLGRTHLLYDILSCFFALVIGILLVSVRENVARQKREAELRRRQAEAELNLLKAQLQPHFLFNSLNNLYYDVYKSLPDVARRIAMLSDIMRYFMEQSPREKVALSTELEFIRNYIALERVRLPHPVSIQWEQEVDEGIMVPPMLLMPLVENLFKHGIDKGKEEQQASLSLQQQEKQLIFTLINALPGQSQGQERKGLGLVNLRERLQLLYGNRFSLRTSTTKENFFTQLIIPLI